MRRRGRYIGWICIGREYAVAGKRAPTRTSLWSELALGGNSTKRPVHPLDMYWLAIRRRGQARSYRTSLWSALALAAMRRRGRYIRRLCIGWEYAVAGKRAPTGLRCGASLLWAVIRRRGRYIRWIYIGREYAVAGKRAPTGLRCGARCSGREFDDDVVKSTTYTSLEIRYRPRSRHPKLAHQRLQMTA